MCVVYNNCCNLFVTKIQEHEMLHIESSPTISSCRRGSHGKVEDLVDPKMDEQHKDIVEQEHENIVLYDISDKLY